MLCVFSKKTLHRRRAVVNEIELSTIDLRYETCRMKNPALERRLLSSIAERGIEEPLEGVESGEERILLNGFKRYRCAEKLRLAMVPYRAISEDEADGIVRVLRAPRNRRLGILEEARFIDHLQMIEKLEVSGIAEVLGRSKAWVSMRLGLIGDMSEGVRKKIFDGKFPVYSYMYTLRRFMRMNGDGKKAVEDFVEAVSGKKLSVREIEYLAHGYFRGPPSFREEIRAGNFTLALDHMRGVGVNLEGVNEFERVLLRDLEITGKYMRRVVTKHKGLKLETRTFYSQANLLAGGILTRLGAFTKALRELYDRSGNA
jgi:hypothetical protein